MKNEKIISVINYSHYIFLICEKIPWYGDMKGYVLCIYFPILNSTFGEQSSDFEGVEIPI